MNDHAASTSPEHISVYQHFRKIFGGATQSADARKRSRKSDGASVPFGLGRDPKGIDEVLGQLTAKLGWNSPLARAELLQSWAELAGTETAEHATPIGIEDGVLTVRCDSTAWATQLRLMRSHIITEIAVRYPEAGITSVRLEGPDAPSWKRGPRSIPGRGPRDTYG